MSQTKAHQINMLLRNSYQASGDGLHIYGTCMMSELERMVWNVAAYLRLYFDYNVPINTLESNSVPPRLVTSTSIYTMYRTFSVENYYIVHAPDLESRVSRM